MSAAVSCDYYSVCYSRREVRSHSLASASSSRTVGTFGSGAAWRGQLGCWPSRKVVGVHLGCCTPLLYEHGHRPDPYQIVAHSALVCSCPGQGPFSLPVADRWQSWISVRSGTDLARRPSGYRPSDLLIRRVRHWRENLVSSIVTEMTLKATTAYRVVLLLNRVVLLLC